MFQGLRSFTGTITAAALLAAPASAVLAAPIQLGAAGPGNWAVLQIGTGKIDMSNPDGFVAGDVGVAAGGEFKSSGPDVLGRLVLASGASWDTSGDAVITGGVIVDDALMAQAIADALHYSSVYGSLDATLEVAGGLITETTVLDGGAGLNVLDLTKIDLNDHETLTLTAPAGGSWIVNISDQLKLNNHSVIQLGGDLAFNEVLFNLTGTGGVSFAGGGNSSQLTGIILSPAGKVTLSPGLVIGEIISGEDISIVSGAEVVNPIPLPPALWLFGAALLALVRPARRAR